MEVDVPCAGSSVVFVARVIGCVCVIAPLPVAEGSWFVRVILILLRRVGRIGLLAPGVLMAGLRVGLVSEVTVLSLIHI